MGRLGVYGGIGFYLGIYVDQNYQIPRVPTPDKMVDEIKKYFEEKSRHQPEADRHGRWLTSK